MLRPRRALSGWHVIRESVQTELEKMALGDSEIRARHMGEQALTVVIIPAMQQEEEETVEKMRLEAKVLAALCIVPPYMGLVPPYMLQALVALSIVPPRANTAGDNAGAHDNGDLAQAPSFSNVTGKEVFCRRHSCPRTVALSGCAQRLRSASTLSLFLL